MLPVLDPGRGETGRDPFHEGVRARRQGFSWADCPYPPGTYRRCDWLDGWDEEDTLSPSMAKAGRRR